LTRSGRLSLVCCCCEKENPRPGSTPILKILFRSLTITLRHYKRKMGGGGVEQFDIYRVICLREGVRIDQGGCTVCVECHDGMSFWVASRAFQSMLLFDVFCSTGLVSPTSGRVSHSQYGHM
jgi:hypothetical protein